MGNSGTNRAPASVVLIHGFGFASFVWQPLARRLTPDYKVHCLTLAGYDGTDEADATQDFAQLATREDAHWVGWSMGGLVALASIEAGLRPRSLTLLASQPCMVAREDYPHAISGAAFQDFRRRIQENPAKAMQHFTALVAHGDADENGVREQLQDAPLPETSTLARGMDVLEQSDFRATWARGSAPQQCILAERDALIPADARESLNTACPGARIARIKRAGHAPLLSQPDACAALLRAFWED